MFKFRWKAFDDDFYTKATSQLEQALNNGPKPQHICDNIMVIELNMGSVAPNLEIMEITDLALDKFRGIFRLEYAGDAFVILQTKVQVNPVTVESSSLPRSPFVSSPFQAGMLSAHKPLVVPLQMKICNLELDAILSLSVSQRNGVTLAFKNDPIKSVLVHSTFDDTQSVRDMLQNEIEKQLRSVFVDVVPRVLHEISMEYATGEDLEVEEMLKVPNTRRPSSANDFMLQLREDDDDLMFANKSSLDSGIGPSMSHIDLASAALDPDFDVPPPHFTSLSNLRPTISAPPSPTKRSAANISLSGSSPNISPRTSVFQPPTHHHPHHTHHQSLSMHLYPPYRNLSTRSEVNIPASVSRRAAHHHPEFDSMSLPRPSASSASTRKPATAIRINTSSAMTSSSSSPSSTAAAAMSECGGGRDFRSPLSGLTSKARRSAPILMSPSASRRDNCTRLSSSPPVSPIVGLHPSNLRSNNSASFSSKHIIQRPKE